MATTPPPSLFQRYVIDANVILNFWIINDDEPFGKDVHTSAWDYIEEQIDLGAIVAPIYVKAELIKHGPPELVAWLKSRDYMFIPITNEYKPFLIQIVKLHPIYKTTNGSKTDAAIVALGAARGLTVITSEKREAGGSRSTRNPKIPNVCEDLSVRWASPTGYFRLEGKSF